MYSRIILLVTALFMSSAASSEEINIQLGNDSARFMYLTEAFGQDFGRLELEAGLLYNETDGTLINVGLLVRGESVSVPMIVSVGARGYFATLGSSNVAAIAIGGDLLFSPESWGGLGAGVYYYTAPGVVSFADSEGLTEYGIYVNFQITPQAKLAVGYQKIDVSITNSANIIIDSGAYFALNLSF